MGSFNPSADKVKREDCSWSDMEVDEDYSHVLDKIVFERLKCGECGGLSFEVLAIAEYETAARCNLCGMYYRVHSG